MLRIVKITVVVGILVLCGSALAVDSTGLVAHWKFDEGSGTIAYDSAGSNDGTLVNGPMWTTGKIDGALSFDGTNDYIIVGDPPDESLDFETGNFSISLWFKTTDSAGELVDKSGGGGGRSIGYSLFIGAVEVGAGEDRADPGALCLRIRDGFNLDMIETTNTYDDGTWHHLVAIRAGSGSANLDIYVDGENVPTTSRFDQGAGDISNHYNLSIGAKFDAGDSNRWEDFLDGIIDDVRIYNRALSAGEVRELYLSAFSAYERAVYRLDYAIGEKEEVLSTIEETLDEEAKAYDDLEEMLESKDYGDLKKRDIIKAKQDIHSSMQHEEQAAGAVERSIDKLYSALTALGWEPTDPNLISHWKFDEGSGTIAYDSAGSNDGTLVNGPTWTTGKIDGALDFDGVDDYVDCGNTFASVTGSATKSIMAWVKPKTTDCSSGGLVIDLYRRSDSSSAFKIRAHGNPAIWRAGYMKTPTTYGYFDSGVAVATEWTHIALVQDSSDVGVYINGVWRNGVSDGAAPSISNPPNASVGAYVYYGSALDCFNGTIDDVRIYDKALTAEEIQELYQDGF
ncbi:MAG: LamG domain-containing protein [Planctomycetota bacterium]|nr:MAG: LamG domain-containing protein [Planctomycetota bacterium]